MTKRLDHSKWQRNHEPKRCYASEKSLPHFNPASEKQITWCESILGVKIKKLNWKQAQDIIDAYLKSKNTNKPFAKAIFVRMVT